MKRTRLQKSEKKAVRTRLQTMGMEAMPMMFYAKWYKKDVSPHLSMEQKKKLLKKISDISLERPLHIVGVEFSKKEFPELAPYMHTKTLSGLQLYAVMTELFNEVHPKHAKRIGKPYPSL